MSQDPYIGRPLPCMIGGATFDSDDRVGLGELSPGKTLVKSALVLALSESNIDFSFSFSSWFCCKCCQLVLL